MAYRYDEVERLSNSLRATSEKKRNYNLQDLIAYNGKLGKLGLCAMEVDTDEAAKIFRLIVRAGDSGGRFTGTASLHAGYWVFDPTIYAWRETNFQTYKSYIEALSV